MGRDRLVELVIRADGNMEHGRSPYWLEARFESVCACGKRIVKGDQAYYYPSSRKAVCEACGLKGASDMADELAYAGESNPY